MSYENKYISYWLLLITFLVALMIIIGGLTRLTDSGLSITKWDLFSGIIPPISIDDWNEFFLLYKTIPEYKLINYSMTLEQFKIIFWWEYAHRLLGRLVGVLYFFPLLYFTIKKQIKRNSLFYYYLIFALITIQGIIGWYMVKSGLTDRTDVSHYRLSLHLTLAFVILSLLFWSYLQLSNKKKVPVLKKIPLYLPLIFFICLLLQISMGALVSGLDAGKIYQTWPLMNESYFPDDSNYKDLISSSVFNNPSIVQFIHRNFAYLIFLLFIVMLFIVYNDEKLIRFKGTIAIISFLLLLQIVMGVLTVINGAQLLFASGHQISSIFLLLSSISLIEKNSN